jgi:hypothetical protein
LRRVDASRVGRNNAGIRIVALIALVLGLSVPVTQLRSSVVVRDRCCCPDPAYCHCPDHRAPSTPAPVMDRCGKTHHLIVAPTLPDFTPAPIGPVVALVARPAPDVAVPTPHAPPDPARPAAPS